MPLQSVPLAYHHCASEGCTNKELPEETVISPWVSLFTGGWFLAENYLRIWRSERIATRKSHAVGKVPYGTQIPLRGFNCYFKAYWQAGIKGNPGQMLSRWVCLQFGHTENTQSIPPPPEPEKRGEYLPSTVSNTSKPVLAITFHLQCSHAGICGVFFPPAKQTGRTVQARCLCHDQGAVLELQSCAGSSHHRLSFLVTLCGK